MKQNDTVQICSLKHAANGKVGTIAEILPGMFKIVFSPPIEVGTDSIKARANEWYVRASLVRKVTIKEVTPTLPIGNQPELGVCTQK